MRFDSGLKVYRRYSDVPLISSGDSTLDELLGGGGFHKDLVYLLYGDKETKKRITNILLTTAVNAQKSFVNGGFGDGIKIAFVDANNRFNPYNVGKYAVSQHLSPKQVLENIQVARAFTWDQMVELLENKLSKLEHVKVVLISGITTLFQGYEKQTFEDLLKAIGGIKKILERANPLIVITAPLNQYSTFRPKGGKTISHFGSVLILVRESERNVDYKLVQHPFLPENSLVKWKPKKNKRNLSNSLKNTTLDCWI
jgi:RecA/RadA recombinase